MKKLLSIDLSDHSFGIEEEAYEMLHVYIGSFQSRFAQENTPKELLATFEKQVAAFFVEKQRFGMATIKSAEVSELMTVLGSPDNFQEQAEEPLVEELPYEEEFVESTSSSFSEGASSEGRRLYRDVDNRMIGGVAAGLSNYLDVDVSVVRVILLVLYLFAFPFIAAYLIAWLLLKPEPKGKVWAEQPHRFHKKLFRNTRASKIGGVAIGIAEYLNCSPIWIRLLFILSLGLCCLFGLFPFIWVGISTIPIYVVLWIILPPRQQFDESNFSTSTSSKTGAEEFAETIRQTEAKGLDESISKGFNKGAGCAANGCGCLVFLIVIPILLCLFIAFGSAFFGLPLMWSPYIYSPDYWLELLPHWMQILLSVASSVFVLLTGIGFFYLLLRVLLDLPRLPVVFRALFWAFWGLSVASLIICLIFFVLGISPNGGDVSNSLVL